MFVISLFFCDVICRSSGAVRERGGGANGGTGRGEWVRERTVSG